MKEEAITKKKKHLEHKSDPEKYQYSEGKEKFSRSFGKLTEKLQKVTEQNKRKNCKRRGKIKSYLRKSNL
jgi:hypothetical protein